MISLQLAAYVSPPPYSMQIPRADQARCSLISADRSVSLAAGTMLSLCMFNVHTFVCVCVCVCVCACVRVCVQVTDLQSSGITERTILGLKE